MSEDRVIGQFDVTLSEELVKDVQTTGRPVKTEIWEQGEGKRGLVGCIFVDKNEQDVVRLRVTGNSRWNNIYFDSQQRRAVV